MNLLTKNKPARIVLVDDHAIVRHALKTIITTHDHYTICSEASDFEEGLKKISHYKPDIAVIDISLPKRSGLELINPTSNTKFLVLSMHEEDDCVLEAIGNGAVGYLNKDTAPQEILLALQTILNGQVYFQKRYEHLQKIIEDSKNNFRTNDCAQYHPLGKLSKREREVFFLIVNGKPNRIIAKQLFLSPRTVETHRSRLIKKLGLATTADLVRFAIKHRLLTA
jgi:DNA-binding NarL/FixJ family response regulator